MADAVLVLVILAATDRLSKVELREQAVFRVDDPTPEAVLLEPPGELVAEHALGLLADEGEAIAQRVRLPDDRVDLTEDRRQSCAASFGLGMRSLLLGELQAECFKVRVCQLTPVKFRIRLPSGQTVRFLDRP